MIKKGVFRLYLYTLSVCRAEEYKTGPLPRRLRGEEYRANTKYSFLSIVISIYFVITIFHGYKSYQFVTSVYYAMVYLNKAFCLLDVLFGCELQCWSGPIDGESCTAAGGTTRTAAFAVF